MSIIPESTTNVILNGLQWTKKIITYKIVVRSSAGITIIILPWPLDIRALLLP